MFCISITYKDQLLVHYLPDTHASKDTIIIPQRSSGLDRDVLIYVRTLDEACHVRPDASFHWQNNTNNELSLEPGKPVICSGKGLRIQVNLSIQPVSSTLLAKYTAPSNAIIRIGQDDRCQLELQGSTPIQADIQTGTNEGHISIRRAQVIYVNGTQVSEGHKHRLRIGSIIRIGELIIVYLGNQIAVNQPSSLVRNSLTPSAPQRIPETHKLNSSTASSLVQYHRSPRILQPIEATPLSIEGPIAKQVNNTLPLLMTIGPSATMILPMLVSSLVTDYDVSRMLIMMGGSAVLSIFWATINYRYRKSASYMTEEKRQALYAQYIQELESRLMALSEQERARLEDQCLSIANCLELPTSNTHRLWERAATHDDFGELRLGTGDAPLPSPISIPDDRLNMIDDPLRDEPLRLKETYQTIHNAPISINVRTHNLIGVLGRQKHPHLMHSLVMQLAATHSYHDMRIAVLHTPQTSSQWEWARWLPHAYASDDHELRMVVSTPQAIQEVISYLENVLHIRQERSGEKAQDVPMPLPHYVIFCTDPAIMEDQPFLQNISTQSMGFTLVVQASAMELLPRECSTIVQANEQQGAVYGSKGDVTNVAFEWPQLDQLNHFSSAIAPIRSKEHSGSSAIPTMVTFLDIYNVRNVDDLDVWRFWNENHAYDGLQSIIGLRAGSKPFILDISDKPSAHGPHGLVAGTTGAGKSVLLQTYILSLALNYHPDEVQFILIDYKGGGTNNVFRHMPHVCGIIDNLLSNRDLQRALQSIEGEITRREHIFKRLGINHIDDYIRFFNSDPSEPTMGHIIIIVDEFAEMAKEQPDFMKQLISCARVGRSVGIHLILATQKPSNSVNNEIWANTRFRISLRVATPSDSNEMLKRPDAAYLRGMGRCYVQVGYDEIFEQVQTSYAGADYAPFDLTSLEQPKLLNEAGQIIKLKSKKKKSNGRKQKYRQQSMQPIDRTPALFCCKNDRLYRLRRKIVNQMDAVLDRIDKVAKLHGIQQAHRLWLDPLPRQLLLSDLPIFASNVFDGKHWPAFNGSDITVPYGLLDDVGEQRHFTCSLNLTRDHNHMIVGTAATGKTTLLQTLAMSLALRYSPDQVQMYVFSLTSKSLSPLAELPHVGDVVYADNPSEITSLLQLIIEEDTRRKDLLQQAATDSIVQYNLAVAASSGAIAPLPFIVVMIDRMSQLQELSATNETLSKQMSVLIAEAASRGIYFIITALSLDRTEIPIRLIDKFKGVALQLPGRDVYKEVLHIRPGIASLSTDAYNIDSIPGRGLATLSDPSDPSRSDLCETQTAVFGSATDVERIARITEIGREMSAAWKGQLPRSILRIPTPFTYKSMIRTFELNPVNTSRGVIPLGFYKQSTTPLYHDFNKFSSFLFTGSVGGGKTNGLLVAARQFSLQGAEIHFLGTPGTQAASVQIPNMTFYDFTDQNTFAAFHLAFRTMLQERINVRNQHRKDKTMTDIEYAASLRPYVILIDNLEEFIPLYKSHGVLDYYLSILQKGTIGVFMLYGINSANLKKERLSNAFADALGKLCHGVSLSGHIADNLPWDVNLPFDQRKLILPLGEGMHFNGVQYTPIILPTYA